MITMEYIKSDFDNKYPILNVELLGKPIHTIKDELANILNRSLTELTDQIQKWIKNLSQKGFIPYNEATSKMQHGLVVFDFLFPTNKQSTITV